MNRHDCETPDLTDSAEVLLAGPPWWLHAILFGLSVLLIAAVVTFLACVTS
jgi:hypothetical protein